MVICLLVLSLSLYAGPVFAETITKRPPEPPPETEDAKLELIEGLIHLELQLARQKSISFPASVYFESKSGQFIVSTHADSALRDVLVQLPSTSKLSVTNDTLFFQLETRQGDKMDDALLRSGLRAKKRSAIPQSSLNKISPMSEESLVICNQN